MAKVHVNADDSEAGVVDQKHILVVTGASHEVTSHHVAETLLTDALKAHGIASSIRDYGTGPGKLVAHADALGACALACLVQDVKDRRQLYKLVSFLHANALHMPVMLMGRAVDPDYAQVLALPDSGTLYRGGIYYCEDVDEMLQVLEHIILYTPPRSEHDHSHEPPVQYSCTDCASCGSHCDFNL